MSDINSAGLSSFGGSGVVCLFGRDINFPYLDEWPTELKAPATSEDEGFNVAGVNET